MLRDMLNNSMDRITALEGSLKEEKKENKKSRASMGLSRVVDTAWDFNLLKKF